MKTIFLLSFLLLLPLLAMSNGWGMFSDQIKIANIGNSTCSDSVVLSYRGHTSGMTYRWINESDALGVIGTSVNQEFRTVRQPNAPGTYQALAGVYRVTITSAQYPAGLRLWTCILPVQTGSAPYNVPDSHFCPIDSIGYIAHSIYLRAIVDYVWDHGPTTCRISGRVPGTFSRTSFFTDSTGCRRALSRERWIINDSAPRPITTSTTTTNTNCTGVKNGTITLYRNNNIGRWSDFYAWDSGLPPTRNQTGLAAGTYNVTTTSENGCTTTNSITVTNNTVNPRITSATTPNTNCAGAQTGSITLTTNATSFVWSNSSTTQNPTGLSAGAYNVTATGTNGCTTTASITVTNNTVNPTITSATTPNKNCAGVKTGTITLTTNATTFVWDNNLPTTQNQTGLAASTYNVTATGTNGCTATASITVTNNMAYPTITSATTPNTNCTGAQTGTIRLTSNATTFAWSNGATTQNPTGLAAGAYNVTATGTNGCTATASITVTNNTVNPTITSATTPNTNCTGAQTGSITLENYMTSFASFVWSNTATTRNPIGLAAGTYNVTATGTNGCTATASITVTNNTVNPTITSATTPNTNCTGAQTGTIRLTSNATTFAWSNGATTQNPTGLAAGTYNVTATGTNGCTATTSVTVTGNYTYPNFQTSSRENERCTGPQTGSITLTTNATSFAWSNSSTTQNLTGLAAGTYNVTATGANGCTATASIIVYNHQLTPYIAWVYASNTNCAGAQGTGSIELNTNATSFAWDNNLPAIQNQTGLATGTYNVTATGTNGCTATASITINSNTVNPMLWGSSIPNTRCTGAQTGSITLNTNATSFAWNNNLPATQNQTGLSAGTYTVTATGTNGCTATASITVTNNTVNPTIISSIRGDVGSIWLTTNATTFAWSNGATTKDLTGLSAGTYNVTVTGTNGCTATASITVAITKTETTTEKFGIYPNPTTGRIYFSQTTQFLLYNESGENLSRSSLEVDYCDLSEYPTGVYMIIIGHTVFTVVKK
jgi:hypothetical protein